MLFKKDNRLSINKSLEAERLIIKSLERMVEEVTIIPSFRSFRVEIF